MIDIAGYKFLEFDIELDPKTKMASSRKLLDPKPIYQILTRAKFGDVECQLHIGDHFYNNGYKEFAAKWYKLAAEKDDFIAINSLAQMLLKGEYKLSNKDYSDNVAEAFKLFKKAAENGTSHAQKNLADMYFNGLGTPINKEEAFNFYQLAANQGLYYAQNKLGLMLKNGDGIKPNIAEAVAWFRKAASQDYHYAQYNLAMMLLRKKDSAPEEKQEAIDLFVKAANSGNPDSHYQLGKLYYRDTLHKNLSLAEKWLRLASNLNHTKAMYLLADLIQQGVINSPNPIEAKDLFKNAAENGHVHSMYKFGLALKRVHSNQDAAVWLERAAENNHRDAQYAIAQFFKMGIGVKQNKKTAVFWYRKSAEQNHDDAQSHLAKILYYGEGVPADKSEAFNWYLKVAVRKKDPDAYFHLALMLHGCDGIPPDKQKALEYFTVAAQLGHDDAQSHLAKILYHGEGVPTDKREAFNWYSKVAVRKKDPDAYFHLALMLHDCDGITPDKQKALEYFSVAAQLGHEEAKFNLAVMLINGERDEDITTAFNLFHELTIEGHTRAQYNLGVMFEAGIATDKDLEKARSCYKSAAEKGHSKAHYNYAYMLYKGLGGDMNKSEAAHWCKRAAEQGHADAQYSYAFMLRNGVDVELDLASAIDMFQKAAAQGHVDALESLANIYFKKERTPENHFNAFLLLCIIDLDNEGRVTNKLKIYADNLDSIKIEEAKTLAKEWKIGDPLPLVT